jgi:hypothetical protein
MFAAALVGGPGASGLASMRAKAQDGRMSDSGPQVNPDPMEKIAAALTRAMTEIADGFRPVMETLAKMARDPRARAAFAADREPGRPGCHCLCGAVHRDDPGICDGEAAATVRILGMDVPMCAPCQAARAASKLSRQP